MARTSTHRQVEGEGGGRRNRQEHCKIIKGGGEGEETGRGGREKKQEGALPRSSSRGGTRVVTLRLCTLFRFPNRHVWAWTCFCGGTQDLPRLPHAPCPRAWPFQPSAPQLRGGVTRKRRCAYRPSVIYLIVKNFSLSLSLSTGSGAEAGATESSE